MYKLLAGVLSITILAPVALLSGGGGAFDNPIDALAAQLYEIPVESNVQKVVANSEDVSVGAAAQVSNVNNRLQAFVEQVYTGQPNVLTGIFVDGGFAMDIVQQPSNNPGYISPNEEAITEFRLAKDYGSIGLLAHNYLAGEKFFQIYPGQTIYLVYGDSKLKIFTVADVKSYQALSPNSPYSEFVDLDDGSMQLSAVDLFYATYGQEGALVMQTCIEKDGLQTWGRLFIIAVPGGVPSNLVIEPL